MRHAYISTVMAGVPVITSAGSVRAQEADTGARPKPGSRCNSPRRPDFTLAPAMARALTLQQPGQTSGTSHGPRERKTKAAVGFGLIGMLAGAAIGSQATKNCGCDDREWPGASTGCSSARRLARGLASGWQADSAQGIYNGGRKELSLVDTVARSNATDS